jgi:hypothetical protein
MLKLNLFYACTEDVNDTSVKPSLQYGQRVSFVCVCVCVGEFIV